MKENKIAYKLYNKDYVDKIESRLNLLGISKTYDATKFLIRQLLLTLISFIIALLYYDFNVIYAFIVSVITYFGLIYLLVDRPLRARTKLLEEEAMHFFEVLTLSLETSRNLESAVITTCDNVPGALSKEFLKAVNEVKYGKSLTESLIDMKTSIPSETINNIIISITQSNVFGNGIIQSLYNQIDYLREKKIMEVKAEISKVPTKISIISVIFFIPLILLIILAPALIQYIG